MKYVILALVTLSILGWTMFLVKSNKIQQPKYKVYYEYNVYRHYIKLNNDYYKVIADTIPVDTVYVQVK